MKAISVILASVAALCAAQDPSVITVHPDGTYTCAVQNAAYCAGTTLDTTLILLCVNGTGQVGNCNDYLAGEAPDGVNFAPCWQSSPTAGDAACSKNGTVYPDSGSDAIYNCTAPFPVPGSVVTGAGSASGTTTSLTTSTAASPSIDLADAATGIPTSTTTFTSWSTIWMSDSTGTGTVFITLPTTIDTTICPETASTSPIDSSSMIGSSMIDSSMAGAVTPSAPSSTIAETTTYTTWSTISSAATVFVTASSATASSATASSIASAVTPSVSSSTTSETTTYTTWSTISSATTLFVTVSSATASSIASAMTPLGPVYTFSTNSTTVQLGPGLVSTSSFDVGAVGTASTTPYSFAPSGNDTSSQDIVGAASASGSLLIPYDTAPAGGYLSYAPTTVLASSTASSSMDMAGAASANTTVVSPNATAGPIFTGDAAKYGNAKVAAMVVFGLLVVALI